MDYCPPPDFQVDDSVLLPLLKSPHVGVAYGVGQLDEDTITDYQIQSCWVSPGGNDIIMTGALSQASREGIMWCKSFAETFWSSILEAFGLPPPPSSSSSFGPFYKPEFDLHVHVAHSWHPLPAAYQMGAIFMSLVSLMVGRRAMPHVAVLGDLSNLGELISDWEVTEEMIHFCRLRGIHTLVVGHGTTIGDKAKKAASSRDEIIEVHTVWKVLDAIPFCFDV